MQFSVVIPTYHRPERLRAALLGLASLEFPREGFEVVVVNDGPNEASRRVVHDFLSALPLRYVALPARRGPATARNLGARSARGAMLAFLDDDCVPSRDWLSRFADAFRRHGSAPCFGGQTLNARDNTTVGIASQGLVDFLYAWYNRDAENARFFTTNNLACPRVDFLRLGGFDESFQMAAAEDRDFCDRWREHGLRLVYVEDAIVYHKQRTTLAAFLRQQVGYGRGAVDLHLARDRRGVARPRLESLRFYANLVTHPLGRQPFPRSLACMALSAASQVAYGWGYFSELHQRRHPGS